MKITHVIGHEVVVPSRPGRANSEMYGPSVFDTVSKIIIEVHTDAGLVGLGETMRGTAEGAIRSGIERMIDLDWSRLCLQEPPLQDLSNNDMYGHPVPDRPHRLWETSFSTGNEMALHAALLDLMGKQVGQPASALMGGAYRDRIPVDYWMARMTPEDSARVCAAASKAGYRGVKCKCALEDDLVERAEAVGDVCGADFKITFDPNGRFYRPSEAMPMFRRLVEVGNIGCLEDPFPSSDLEWWRLLRQQGLFPIALGTVYGPVLIEAIRAHACDYANLNGLPWDIRKAGDVCWAAGMRTWHGSGLDLGVLEALYRHTCAVTKSMTLPSDILGRSIREHNLVTDAMPVEDGMVAVPTGPGLGVALDRDALDKYKIRQFTIDV